MHTGARTRFPIYCSICLKPEIGGYRREYAFRHDEVAPISGSFSDPRNGWGATIVDAMSTMVRNSRYSV